MGAALALRRSLTAGVSTPTTGSSSTPGPGDGWKFPLKVEYTDDSLEDLNAKRYKALDQHTDNSLENSNFWEDNTFNEKI